MKRSEFSEQRIPAIVRSKAATCQAHSGRSPAGRLGNGWKATKNDAPEPEDRRGP